MSDKLAQPLGPTYAGDVALDPKRILMICTTKPDKTLMVSIAPWLSEQIGVARTTALLDAIAELLLQYTQEVH